MLSIYDSLKCVWNLFVSFHCYCYLPSCNNIFFSYLDLGKYLLAYFSASYLPCFQAVLSTAAG